MSTVKISELPAITRLNSNTSNTLILGVDIPTGVTGKINATVLAESLYSNNILNVGNNNVIFPGVIGQFVSNNESYLQVNLQNLKANGSSDYVATADVGTDAVNYIDMGIAGSTDDDVSYPIIKRLDGYLYVQGNTATTAGGNLLIGAITTHRDITFFQGGAEANNAVAKFVYNSGLHLLQKPLTFADGTSQNTSFAAAATAANAAFLQANTTSHVANSSSLYANGAFIQANAAFLQANTPSHVANSAAIYANGAFTKANNALANTTGTFAGSLTVTGTISTGNVTINNGVTVNGAGLFQYTNANNTTVTQLTDKSSPVTCNGRTGQITTSNGSLAGGRSSTFRVNSSQVVSSNDIIIVGIASGATGNTYQVCVSAVAAGYFDITISNVSSSSASDILVINYAIFRVQ